jgi:hypothetical protein
MQSIYLQNVLSNLLTNFSTRSDDGRGSGRILAWAISLLLLLPGAAFADARDEFPDNRCPGSGCPDNAKPKAVPCGQEGEDSKHCSREGAQ